MPHFSAYGSRGRRLIAFFLALVAASVFLVATGTVPAKAAAPTCTFYNYYGQGASGTNNYGTADKIWTWSSWNVPNEAGGNFSDEAVWSIDYDNQNNALEVGFFTGWGNGDLHGGQNYTNGMVPYYTLRNGQQEADYWGSFLPRNIDISMYALANASKSFAYVNGQLNTSINYVVSQPRWGFTQGETNDSASTMGGTTGDSSVVQWIDSSNSFHNWTYINICANSPYWVASANGTDDFTNGGGG